MIKKPRGKCLIVNILRVTKQAAAAVQAAVVQATAVKAAVVQAAAVQAVVCRKVKFES
jgi:hypothetical protein